MSRITCSCCGRCLEVPCAWILGSHCSESCMWRDVYKHVPDAAPDMLRLPECSFTYQVRSGNNQVGDDPEPGQQGD